MSDTSQEPGTAAWQRRCRKLIHGQPHHLRLLGPRSLADVLQSECETILGELFHPHQDAKPPTVRCAEDGLHVGPLDFRSLIQVAGQVLCPRDIIWPLHASKVSHNSEFVKAVQRVPWDLVLPKGAALAARVQARQSRLYHEGMLQEWLAKELARLGFAPGERDDADYLVDVRLIDNRLELGLSLSRGQHYRRGIKRDLRSLASMREDLAAAASLWCLQEAGFKTVKDYHHKSWTVVVPFAGSGTLAYEAAIRLAGIPRAFLPEPLSLESLPCTPAATWSFLQQRWRARFCGPGQIALRLLERDLEQFSALETNTSAFMAAVEPALWQPAKVKLIQADVYHVPFSWCEPAMGWAMLPLNPPYGDRLATTGNKPYAQLGGWVREFCTLPWAGVCGYCFAPDQQQAQDFVRALPDLQCTQREVQHGGKDVVLLAFHSR